MASCLSDESVVSFLEGRLSREDRAELAGHIDVCEACRELISAAILARSGAPELADTADAQPGVAPALPPTLDEFRLVRLLGRGAMGQVYLGHDTLLDRAVAIKFLLAAGPASGVGERLLSEARAIARLQHPNVVSVYRVAETGGLPYLVTEFVRGDSLDQLPRPLPWERALAIGRGLARGLGAAHRRGVLHRDIKPGNAILSAEGEAKLLDFGLATLATGAGPPSSAGAAVPQDAAAVVGTPLYMAPEVWRGQGATRRSDVYSLGALLYELCSGRPPHRQPTLETLRAAVLAGPAAPLRDRAASVDGRLAAVIDRCLHPDPQERYASGSELSQALEQLGAEPGAALPASDAAAENPYRGLSAFQAEHRALFFGRDAEVSAVLDRLRGEPLCVVAGDSGVGKSSLCRAGVLPRVAAGALDRRFAIALVLPGRRPLSALCAALAPLLGIDESQLLTQARADAGAPGRLLRARGQRGDGVLLFVDQAEELLTQGDEEQVERAFAVLADLSLPDPGVRLLLTVRGDFLMRLAARGGMGEEIQRGLYLLPPLSADGLHEAVVGPARARGVRFESEALIASLIEGPLRTPGALPLLQFALAELWTTRDQGQRCITSASLEAMGGVEGALARHADGVLARLAPAERPSARRVLLGLVTSEGTRRRRGEQELCGDDRAAHTVLRALLQGRILHARQGAVYEIAHEALLTGWATLRGWLDGDAALRAARQRVEAAAAEWERLGRAPGALWTYVQLAEVAGLEPAALAARDAAFLMASRRAVRGARLRRALAILVVPLLAAGVYLGVRLKDRRDLRRSVEVHVSAGTAALAEGREHAVTSGRLRQESFALFDDPAAPLPGAEARWAKARAMEDRAESALRRAAQELEAAFVRDPTDRRAASLLADVLYERALLAERTLRLQRRDELLQRMANLDDDGRRRALIDAPAELSVGSEPPGAALALARYEERDGRLALGPPEALGRAPYGGKVRPGSYLLTLTLPDRPPLHQALLLGRGERLALRPALPRRVPAGFVHVPPGCFLFGSAEDENMRRSYFDAPPLHRVCTGAYLIGQREVTFAEWISFLDALPREEAARRAPRAASAAGGNGPLELLRLPDGAWELLAQPASARLRARAGEPVRYAGRDRRAAQDWLRFPVAAISQEDAAAYVGWLHRSGRLPGARLCDEREWERAGRGADARLFPHGDHLAPDDANFDETYGRAPEAFGPDEVGAHPASRSPYGLDDIAGNVFEFVRAARAPDAVRYRGGAWYFGQLTARLANANASEPTLRHSTIGLRVCASVAAEASEGP